VLYLGLRGSFDLSTASGYYGLLYYYLVMMATIHSAMIGTSIISKEEQNKTTEFIVSKPVTRSEIIMLLTGMFILQLIFLLVGTAFAASSKNPKMSSGLALTILLTTLILAKVIDMNSKLEGLKYFTPIKYFEAEQLLLQGGFKPIILVLYVVIIAILFSSSYVFYK
jgi:ABC-2 type transport system permease protein